MPRPPALAFLLATVLVDMLGPGIVVPIMPSLMTAIAGHATTGARWAGWIAGAYGATQFLAAPLLGRVADRTGRRPVLVLALGFLSLDYPAHARADRPVTMLAAHASAGAFAATTTVVNACVADVTAPQHRPRAFGYLGAAASAGFVAGPAIGGLLGTVSLRLPLLVAAADGARRGGGAGPHGSAPAGPRPAAPRDAGLTRRRRITGCGGRRLALPSVPRAVDAPTAAACRRSELTSEMASHLYALCFDADQPRRLARFWAAMLGWETTGDPREGVALLPGDDTGFRLRFLPAPQRKIGQNRMHFDLTSTSPEGQRQTVDRALGLGARHIDVGQRPGEGHVVLADPDGNEFCVIAPGNRFLADCGFVGALACDGSQAVGYFWSEALGWPLVWDQDQETAIRSPHGGPKITWGGPPLMPKTGRNRLHFDLAPPADGDQLTEVDRLLALGATRLGPDLDEGDTVAMADPDGNEFCVLTPR